MRAILATLPLLLLAAVPAAARTDACDIAPAKLRTLVASAEADVQRKAGRNIELGEALCAARNPREAGKKFDLAARALGTDLAAVMASQATAAID